MAICPGARQSAPCQTTRIPLHPKGTARDRLVAVQAALGLAPPGHSRPAWPCLYYHEAYR